MKESLISSVLMFTAIFALGLVAACVISYSMLKDGIGSTVRNIEQYFGSGCRIEKNNHTIKVIQHDPVLEIASSFSEFPHTFRWQGENRRFIGIPMPYTSREAYCNYICHAIAGFNFRNDFCTFEFTTVDDLSLGTLIWGRKYDVTVTLPEPAVISAEVTYMSIMNTTNWIRFWAALTEADRNSIIAEMVPEIRKHLKKAGGPLLENAKNRLEFGLRAIMPKCVRRTEFMWHVNQKSFDFELTKMEMIGKQ